MSSKTTKLEGQWSESQDGSVELIFCTATSQWDLSSPMILHMALGGFHKQIHYVQCR